MNRQIAIQTINDMPSKFELDDLIERLVVLDKIEKGRSDIKLGKVFSHEETKLKLGKWLK